LAGHAQIAGRGLARTTIFFQFIGDLVAFVQGRQARAFNRGDVDEHVLAAVLGLNETKALGRVEPLNDTVRHLILKTLFGEPVADPRPSILLS
jgi:hypothetical protein